jgi:hypothetical protein
MFEIEEELKELYRTDYFPARDSQLKKELKLYFPELDKTITNESIFSESMKLTESICSESDLTLGGCEASEFAITVAGVGDEIVGKKLIVTQTVDGQFDMPLGTYRVKSSQKRDDLNFKEILSYDRIVDTDIDISSWYNALSWPQTVKSMRISLLNYIGIEYEEQNLTNDTVSLEKTISPSQLMGRVVLKKLCEINAGFGRMGRIGKFKVVQLSGLGLYPSETLYPSEDLFPAEAGEYVTSGYIKAKYEEYIVEPITAITIREDDEDTGATEGTLENPYVISDNFLLYGKSSAELHTIAANILLQVRNKYYNPHSTTMIGLPYLEPGDSVTIINNMDAIETFIFQRTLSGIQVLRDEIKATGNQKRNQVISANKEIQQLKSKTLKIRKEVDQLSINMSDMEEDLQSQITLTAGQLQTQITNNKTDLQSQITQTAGSLQTQITDNKNNANSQITQLSNSINLKVSVGDVSSQLSVESGQITINSNRLVVNSTNFKLYANGDAEFSGKVKGAEISSSRMYSTGDYGGVTIEKGHVACGELSGAYCWVDQGAISISDQSHSRTTLISGGQISLNAPNAYLLINGVQPSMPGHTHSVLQDGSYQLNWAGSACLFAWSGQNLGQSSYRWGTVYLSSAPSVSSDRNLKHDIEDLPRVYKELILRLKPMRFKYNDGDSGRYHLGFISQDVEEVLQELGMDSQEFAGFIKSPIYEIMDENGVYDTSSTITGYIYMLRYEEFIAPAIAVIQEQSTKILDFEKRINNLENYRNM